MSHGGPNSTQRHVGDLGNIDVQANGASEGSMQDSNILLFGQNSIIGRMVRIGALCFAFTYIVDNCAREARRSGY